MGEAWHELKQDLKLSKITAIPVDEHMIDILTKELEGYCDCLQKQQHKLKDDHDKENEAHENRFYNNLREADMQYAIDDLRTLNHIARVSDRMFMSSHKEKQRRDVLHGAAFKLSSAKNCFKHHTYANITNISSIFHQDIIAGYDTGFFD